MVTEQTAGHLLAVLREALSNAARHAHATGLKVGLAVDGVTVTLTVTDDGLGIAPGGRRSGLENLRERGFARWDLHRATRRNRGHGAGPEGPAAPLGRGRAALGGGLRHRSALIGSVAGVGS